MIRCQCFNRSESNSTEIVPLRRMVIVTVVNFPILIE